MPNAQKQITAVPIQCVSEKFGTSADIEFLDLHVGITVGSKERKKYKQDHDRPDRIGHHISLG